MNNNDGGPAFPGGADAMKSCSNPQTRRLRDEYFYCLVLRMVGRNDFDRDNQCFCEGSGYAA